MIQHMK